MLHPSIRDRFQGYQLALERHNIDLDMNHVVTRESATNRISGYHAAKMLVERGIKFTALFACNDAMAMGAMQYLREQGKKIPADISIIGFDDVLEDMSTNPPLSSIRVPKIEMGTEGVRLLLGLFANNNQKSKKVLVPVELIPRESVIKIKNKN
jgi:DNA-binding LacI/PurR family transcriptional regulator